jgi:hypothetical protein
MLFSELYLAYVLARSKEFQIILLDRSLSGTLSSLIHDTSKRPLWKRQCAILGHKTDGIELDTQDLAVGRYHTLDPEGALPPRGDYLRHAVIFLLEKAGKPLSISEIAQQLNLTTKDRVDKLTRYLNAALAKGMFFQESNGKYSLLPHLSGSWARIRKLVEFFGERFFSSSEGNPLQINEGVKARWLTTLDLAFLSLFSIM